MGRGTDGAAGRTEFRWADFRLDLAAYRLERGGTPVAIEPKALDVLALLVAHPGRLLTKQEIFDAAWPGTAVTDHALTRVIAQLRRALGDGSRDSRYIETVPTRGYRWVCPVEIENPAHGDPPSAAVDVPPPRMAAAAGAGTAPAARAVAPVRPGRAALALASLLLVGAGLAAAVWGLRVPQAAPVAPAAASALGTLAAGWPQQVTTHGGLDLNPALSPAGDALAFASDRSGGFEIYVRPLTDGGTDVALTTDGAQSLHPAWSPDGTRIAFHSAAKGGIWVVPARGGVPRQLARAGSRPAWSPDGRWIAFQTDEHADITPSAFAAQAGSTLAMVDAEGRETRALTRRGTPMGGHAAPAWSPDGRFIGFAVFEGGPDDGAWILETASGEVSRLVDGHKLYELAFAPDGSAIYAAGGGEALVYRVPFDPTRGRATGPAEALGVAGVPGVRDLSVSPDGSRLVFAGLALNSQIWAQPLTHEGGPDGPGRALTDDTSRRNSMPVISPDGARVAYVSSRRGEPPNIWMMRPDGSEKRQLTSDLSAEGKPTWFPDSRRLAYFSSRRDAMAFWAIDVETRRDEVLIDLTSRGREMVSLGYPREIEFAPSVTRLALAVIAPPLGTRRLYVTPLEPFAPRGASDPAEWVGYPAWSPDERRLAVEIKDGTSTHAGVIDLATGALRRLTDEPGQTWVRSWSPDGTRIAVAMLRAGRWSLQWIDVATLRRGVMLPDGPANVYVRYPDWSRRGDLVVYERGELRGNVWTLPLRPRGGT